MQASFDPKQILLIASRVKDNSARLFETLERGTQEENLKSLWATLRQDSQIHHKVFQEMAANVDEYIVYEMVAGEYNPYLRDIAPNYTQTQELIVKKTRELFSSNLEAVEFAIYVKIESILAYSALKEYILPAKLDVLNKIIGDDKKILAKLTTIKKQLNRKPDVAG